MTDTVATHWNKDLFSVVYSFNKYLLGFLSALVWSQKKAKQNVCTDSEWLVHAAV